MGLTLSPWTDTASPAAAAPVICLAGPTAAGKSAATMALAERWPIEIINVDSATIYRGMDIGTAKPSREEQSRVSHHLLDILDPAESYSAAAFRRDARACIAAIRARGRIPLLAGGTMLYFKAFRDGIDALPGADAGIRATLEAEAARVGWPAMHAALARVDPSTAARLAPNDSQRIQRALEIFRASGRSMSDWLNAAATGREIRKSAGPDTNAGAGPDTGVGSDTGAGSDTGIGADDSDTPAPVITISLEPSNRLDLHHRIGQRFDAMLESGLLDEVARLRARGDLHPGLPSMRCVGYKQMWRHLDGETDFATAREQSLAATRQLAKRQLTWLRALPNRAVVDCLSVDATSEVIDRFARALDACGSTA
jgi:tRNA dimethylallyltransferase